MRRRLFHASLLALIFSLSAVSQNLLYAQQTPRMEIRVERQTKDKNVEVTSPQHVFRSGDLVRFRFKPSFDGYLYVMDQSTSGKYIVLYPGKDAQDTNRVERDIEYLIPPAQGEWFRVDDPPGYETVYFVISPVRLTKTTPAPLPPEPPPPGAPAELLPRCDDSVFRARGECIDVMAGPHAVSKDDPLPAQLPAIPGTSARDITVINKPTTTVVAPSSGENGPLIYEFRLAHK
ncbi:DUF4384 domain-containing protein [Alloacidobacterium dinghuense]|uniref:DUF4384 domain-containing protein n=1 Tax=Alloacidobacterium dinghuense TaxID=2763107 RepID=A0A7G8BJX7_9BACT|nr:DUF4384 domain-containing protein [Alloacidobacterium dinghuense]QNI32847.1 DUF4384 domain-containing protein [Alloacidobacterium dinghuense]